MRLFVSALLVLSWASLVHATPIAVTESTDFSSAGFTDVGTLDVGVNTISGSVNGALGDFEDTFSFTLLPGQVIIAAQLVITGFTSSSGLPGTMTDLLNGTTSITGNGTIPLTANVPNAQDGTFTVDLVNEVGFSPERNNRYAYSLTATVAVPEPGTVSMLVVGATAAGLGLRVTRRRR